MTNERVTGTVVKLIINKNFGFIKIDGQKGEHFFHRDDYNGNWMELIEKQSPRVNGIMVESPKGPRIGDVNLE